jgi:PPOX class probable F420-dependent enzyme
MTTGPLLTPTARAFLAHARTATLATIAPGGAPRLVPICFVLDPERPVVMTPLDDKPKRVDDPLQLARVRDVLERPTVSLLVQRWDEDWDRLAWLRATGRATLVMPDDAGHASAVAALRTKYPPYADHALEARPLIRVDLERVSSWGELA